MLEFIFEPFRAAWTFIVQAVGGIDEVLGTTVTVIIASIIFIGITALAVGRKDKFEKQVEAAGEEPGGSAQCDRALGERGLRQQD